MNFIKCSFFLVIAFQIHELCSSGAVSSNSFQATRSDDSGLYYILPQHATLHWAAKNGHVGCMRLLLRRGADIEAVDEEGSTPLHCAAQHGSMRCVNLLLDAGANHSAKNNEGFTVLHIAARRLNGMLFLRLLERGLDYAIEDKYGRTAAYYAPDIFKEFGIGMEDDCSPAILPQSATLHWAINRRHGKCIDLLLRRGADLEEVNEDGLTPLYVAARYGFVNGVKLLLDKGANHAFANKDGLTALHGACWNGHAACVRLLLNSGANYKAVNKDGCTPLHDAAYKGQGECVALLLEKGADVRAETNNGYSALDLVLNDLNNKLARHGTLFQRSVECSNLRECVNLLLKKYANHIALNNEELIELPKVNKDGLTALHVAAAAGSEERVELLLEIGAKHNSVNKDGLTALHLAARGGHVGCMILLVEKGADINAVDVNGWSALHYAAAAPYEECVLCLLANGADKNLKTRSKSLLGRLFDQSHDMDPFGLAMLRGGKVAGKIMMLLCGWDKK